MLPVFSVTYVPGCSDTDVRPVVNPGAVPRGLSNRASRPASV